MQQSHFVLDDRAIDNQGKHQLEIYFSQCARQQCSTPFGIQFLIILEHNLTVPCLNLGAHEHIPENTLTNAKYKCNDKKKQL